MKDTLICTGDAPPLDAPEGMREMGRGISFRFVSHNQIAIQNVWHRNRSELDHLIAGRQKCHPLYRSGLIERGQGLHVRCFAAPHRDWTRPPPLGRWRWGELPEVADWPFGHPS